MTGETIRVRLSHLLGQCAVGTVVRGKQFLMAVTDTTKWYKTARPPPTSEIRYVDQVRSSLGIKQILCMPPVATLNDDGKVKGTWIPAVRFPRWMRCPRCGLLYRLPWKGNRDNETLRCKGRQDSSERCKAGLEQVPWVVVHENGYMADVPWDFIAHSTNRSKTSSSQIERQRTTSCYIKSGGHPYLKVEDGDSNPIVRCLCCRSAGRLPQRIPFPHWAGEQPWIRQEPQSNTESQDELGWIIEINDARLHGSINSRALVIPPESRIRSGTVVDRLYSSSDTQRRIAMARSGLQRRSMLRSIARDWRCSVDEILKALTEIERGYPLYGQQLSTGRLHESEYNAFLNPIPDLREDEDFVTVPHAEAWKSLANEQTRRVRRIVELVDQLIEVRRLKEIAVFRGFTRGAGQTIVPPDLRGTSSWLPALALRGEGVFFSLNENALSKWELQEELLSKSKSLYRRYLHHQSWGFDHSIEVSPRFLLLHTLAHALIRQFEFQAGYPAASLRERIYCSSVEPRMAGVLIYVAVPDALGSLGGVVELARPHRFLRVLSAAMDTVRWCSLDPVCGQHTGQGPGLLNLAACHACTLIPETSCAYRNTLLDRTFVNGKADDNILSILDFSERELS